MSNHFNPVAGLRVREDDIAAILALASVQRSADKVMAIYTQLKKRGMAPALSLKERRKSGVLRGKILAFSVSNFTAAARVAPALAAKIVTIMRFHCTARRGRQTERSGTGFRRESKTDWKTAGLMPLATQKIPQSRNSAICTPIHHAVWDKISRSSATRTPAARISAIVDKIT